MAELVFDCIGARPDKFAVVPSMSLTLKIAETTGQRIDAIALRCQIRIEPARRRYSPAEAELLNDLFGDTERWADTLKPMQLTTVSTMVPGFTGSIEIDLPIHSAMTSRSARPAISRASKTGEIPLLLLFSGTVFGSADGKLAVAAGALEQGGPVPAAAQHLARSDRCPFP